jgi:Tol biopolymer transport system component
MARKRLVGLSILLAAVMSACSLATPAFDANGVPYLKGVVIYHRYSDYGAWDSKLFMIDLTARKMTQVGADWKTVVSPINAHFSPDGKSFTFMASSAGLPENEWDVFVSHWDGKSWAEPINLTGPNGKRDEDPKFSPDGKTIAFKQDGALSTIEMDGSNFQMLTDGFEESSMPYFTADGKGLLFERGEKIWLLRDGVETQMTTVEGLSTYYPIGVDDEKFLYTQIQSSRHDSIYFGYYDGREPKRLPFDDRNYESSDPYPYENASQYIFYVTTNPVSFMGGYNLVFADIKNNKIFDMDKVVEGANSDYLELGPCWSGTAPFGG